MKSHNTIIEYDKKGRVIFMKLFEPEIMYKYEYYKGGRICVVESEQNKSNYKTTTIQIESKGKYIDKRIVQNGEKYDIEIEYDKQGMEIEILRINKNKNTKYKRRTIRNKSGEAIVWIEKYNNNSNIGFKVDMSLIKK